MELVWHFLPGALTFALNTLNEQEIRILFKNGKNYKNRFEICKQADLKLEERIQMDTIE